MSKSPTDKQSKRRRLYRGGARCVLAAFAVVAVTGSALANEQLAEGFRDPPAEARPHVWWHWVNGNISVDGIEKDLDWMARIGLGGAQVFNVARPMNSISDEPIAYMSPQWRDAFRTAVEKADAVGLDLGIASSPGWSATGGPWVKPEDAMKKVVWSATDIIGGQPSQLKLPMPPHQSGPFQELSGDTHHGTIDQDYYRDAMVLAIPVDPSEGVQVATKALINGAAVDATSLQDGQLDSGLDLPSSSGSVPGAVEYHFAEPTTVRSARLFIENLPGSVLSGPLLPQLEASDNGTDWQQVSSFIPSASVPSTISFAPVTASHFRLSLTRGKPGPIDFQPAAGVDLRLAGGLGGGGKKPMLAEFQLSSEAKINAYEYKAAFAYADDNNALDPMVGDDAVGAAPSTVIDLTGNMAADGSLNWTPPAGQWRVLRIGYSLTGKTNAPATDDATGLEVDKYDAAAVERYLNHFLGEHRSVTGNALFGLSGLNAIVTDSIEVRPANWTPDLVTKFRERRDYDPRPWLPTLTGAIIGSRQQSNAFLHDFRQTLGELTETEHYATIAKVAEREKLTLYGESLEGNRMISVLGDDLDLRRHADIPMGAMWTFSGSDPSPHYRADMRGAASVAHLYGKPYVAAEVLTSILQPWSYAPADLQPMIDAAFLAGVNRPVIHSVVQQPLEDAKPGMSLQGFGQFFGRHEAWAPLAKPWIDYIARNSYLMQHGRNVADVAYFYGEDTPISVIAAKGYPEDLPAHYGYDFISPGGLAELSVKDGQLHSSGGAIYRAIQLGGTSQFMTLPVLERLAALVDAGATVIGTAPQSSPSLTDDAAKFEALVDRLWGGETGKGRVIAGQPVEAALAASGVAPDFQVLGGDPENDIRFAHRTVDDADIYFLSNRRDVPANVEAQFRVAGRAPEIWRADQASMAPVSFRIEGEVTNVPLAMQPKESFFLIFSRPTDTDTKFVPARSEDTVLDLSDDWTVSFEPDRGAPANVQLDQLAPLSEHDVDGVKYFSGIATYEKSFDLPGDTEEFSQYFLDLGAVGDMAEVKINGTVAGTAWKSPYRLNIGPYLRAGTNTLSIRVANRWINRLIGDQQPGMAKITRTAVPTYTANAPLRPSGLIGPVVLKRSD